MIRIIPADAGNTDADVGVQVEAEDHPRGCGEHSQRERDIDAGRGSSPRMRGTHHAGAE